MKEFLFQEPISNFIDQKIHEARSRVESLTEAQLLDPNLVETLKDIADFRFDLATLRPEGRKGKRRTERKLRTDYGEQIAVEVDFIDVTIPFDGWPKSFHLTPSHCNLIDTPARTSNDGIVVAFPDDENLDRNVDSFIRQVAENLNNLKRDLEKIGPQMLQVAQMVANQRLEKVKARKQRDSERSFTIE